MPDLYSTAAAVTIAAIVFALIVLVFGQILATRFKKTRSERSKLVLCVLVVAGVLFAGVGIGLTWSTPTDARAAGLGLTSAFAGVAFLANALVVWIDQPDAEQ